MRINDTITIELTKDETIEAFQDFINNEDDLPNKLNVVSWKISDKADSWVTLTVRPTPKTT